MAGTGAAGGVGPRVPVNTGKAQNTTGNPNLLKENWNPNPVKIEYNPAGSMFDWKNSFSFAGTDYLWNGNQDKGTVPVVFIGDKSGRYIPETTNTEGVNTGSPISVQSAMDKIINEKMAQPGGIKAMKQILVDKQFINGQQAIRMLAAGDDPDPYFQAAIKDALVLATATNIKIAQQGGKTFMTFDDYLANAAKQGDSTSNGSGSGGTQKRVTYQRFNQEDYDIAIDEMFQQTVGRGATQEELDDFIGKLNSYAKKNPEVTIAKTSGNTTTQTSSGGVSQEAIVSRMRDAALADPEAEGYNKATKYLAYFKEALDSPIELGR